MSRWLLWLLPACGFELGASGDAAPVPDVADVCRNGVVDPGETCDDGGQVLGDGCDVRCQIEPGYVCPSGGTCARVVGLQTMAAELLPTAGTSGGGQPFARNCPVNEVIVGFEGWWTNDNLNVGSTRALCAPITFGLDGRAAWTTTHATNYAANENQNSFATHSCGNDEIAVGFIPNVRPLPYGFVAGWRLVCEPLMVAGGALRFGTARLLATHGPSIGIDSPKAQCAAGGLDAYSGTSGAAFDTLVLHCVSLAAVTE